MNVIDNIKIVRKNKGISHEAMALNLGITQAAYTKLEHNKTKLTVERLYKIAEILEVQIEDLLQVEPKSFDLDIHNQKQVTEILHQQVKNLHQENISIYEVLLQSKDEQIAILKDLLERK